MSAIPEKAGFSAADPAPEETVLDQQSAIDTDAAEARAKAEQEEQKKQAAAAEALKALNSTIPEPDNEQEFFLCMKRLSALLEIPQIQHKDFLRDMTLVSVNLDQYEAPAGASDFAVVQTKTNEIVVAKGFLEFQQQTLSAKDALQGAVIVKNDLASYPDGIKLKGSPRDRYMLMRAADALGLGNNITNRPNLDDIPADVRAEVDEAWNALAANIDLPEVAANEELTPQDRADITAGRDNLTAALNEAAQPAHSAAPAANDEVDTPVPTQPTTQPDYRPKGPVPVIKFG